MELYNGNIVTQPSYNNHSKGKVCPYCGQSSQTIFVRGHEQCVVCKTNVEPCCQGEFIKNVKLEEVGKLSGRKK